MTGGLNLLKPRFGSRGVRLKFAPCGKYCWLLNRLLDLFAARSLDSWDLFPYAEQVTACCRYNENMAESIRNPALPPADDSRDSRSVVSIIDEQVVRGERKLTDLGKRLLESRRHIEHSGLALLNRQELDCERAERRGGVPNQ